MDACCICFGDENTLIVGRSNEKETKKNSQKKFVAEHHSISTAKRVRSVQLSGRPISLTTNAGDPMAVLCETQSNSSNNSRVGKKVVEVFGRKGRLSFRLEDGINGALGVLLSDDNRSLLVCFDSSVRIYDARSGMRQLDAVGLVRTLSDRQLVVERFGKLELYRLTASSVYRGLLRRGFAQFILIDPLEQFFVTTSRQGVNLFDIHSGEWLAQLSNKPSSGGCFAPDGDVLYLSNDRPKRDGQVSAWPIQRQAGHIKFGPPTRLHFADQFRPHHLAIDAKGQMLASDDYHRDQIGLIPLADPEGAFTIKGPSDLLFVDISNDLRWAASGTWHGDDSVIFDLHERTVKRRVRSGASSVQFSRDSQFLSCGSGRMIHIESGKERSVGDGKLEFNFRSGIRQPQDFAGAFGITQGSGGKIALIDPSDYSIKLIIQTNPKSTPGLAGLSASGRFMIVKESNPAGQSISLLDFYQLQKELEALGLDWPVASISSPDRKVKLRIEVVGPKLHYLLDWFSGGLSR